MRRLALIPQFRTRLIAALATLASLIAPAAAQRFDTIAPHAILLDVETGAVLFEKGADELMAPASMAKLMTAHVLFDEIRRGRFKLEDEVVISENAWRRGGAPSGGSTMFAAVGSRVKISDLMAGLIVLSGNDAAIAIAEAISGTEENFAGLMTRRARELGLVKSTFRNATGFSDPQQKVTARELAKLAERLIRDFPDFYPFFGQRDFTWNRMRQQNRNPLLTMDIGADGLKTGNIGESGFGLVGSAVLNGQRLIVVVNGLKTARDRATEARKLLDWGFRGFERKTLFEDGTVIGEADVYGGANGAVGLVAKGPVRLLIPRGSTERIAASIVYRGPLMPPVARGAEVARLRVTRGDTQALDIPLYAATDEIAGGIARRAMDAAYEYGVGLFRRVVGRRA
jgi:D-alanyl-D-alanine carboxypeptidase (penicillin-binding protein 5/6)